MTFINAILAGMGLQIGFFLGHVILYGLGVVAVYIAWRIFIYRAI
jgi:hypothetical protein